MQTIIINRNSNSDQLANSLVNVLKVPGAIKRGLVALQVKEDEDDA